MKFLATVALLAIGVAASPVDIEERSGGGSYQPCPAGLFSVPQCCATDVLGVIGLNCDARKYPRFPRPIQSSSY